MNRSIPAITAGIVAALLLSGCASNAGYSPATAASLQERVLAVSQDAASGTFDSALKRLDAVIERTDAALANGEITAERAARILAAAALVRADIEAAINAQNDSGTTTDGGTGKDGKDSGKNPGKGNKDD